MSHRYGNGKQTRATIALVPGSILLACLVLELLCRVFDPLGISYYPETARYMDTLLPADGVGYRQAPNLRGTFWGAPVSINSLGLRGPEISFERPPNEFRILVMGDSWPFGIGVSYEQTFCHLLQTMIARDARPGTLVRTIDMGVPSYNTEAELAQFQSLGRRLHPNLIILMFAINDIEPKLWMLNKRRRWYVNLAQRSYAASFLFTVLRNRAARPVAKPLTQSIDDMAFLYRPKDPRWLAIDLSLTELNRECREIGIQFVVISETGPATAAGKLLAAVGARERFPLVPLLLAGDPRWKGLTLHNSHTDGHPNPYGHLADATFIYEALVRRGILQSILKPSDSSER